MASSIYASGEIVAQRKIDGCLGNILSKIMMKVVACQLERFLFL